VLRENARVIFQRQLAVAKRHAASGSGKAISYLVLAFCLLGPIAATGQGAAVARKRSPDEVLLVCNSKSRISRAIADDYAQKRHIRNRLSVHCPDSALSTEDESISFAAYTKAIERPVRNYLATHKEINFIVLTKGVPIRILGAKLGSHDEHAHEPNIGCPSVDSFLAALGYEHLPGVRKIDIAGSGAIGVAYANRYWNATEPFSHVKFGGYLVTRLDGYTQADAMALVRRALDAEAHAAEIEKLGKVLLDVQPLVGLGDKTTQPGPIVGNTIPAECPPSEFNADMLHAHDVLSARGVPDELDLTEAFIGHRTNLLGYFSFGSNDAKYSREAYESLMFAPGSLGDTAVSTSGRTFLPTEGGQSLLADLIAHGLTCGKGYVDEPLYQAISSPTIALDRYTAGYTMAESFYAAAHFVAWEDVVIGDPLCSPYFHSTQR